MCSAPTSFEPRLFDASNIDALPWPQTAEAQLLRRYLVPLIKSGARHYIDNLETTLMALQIDQHVLPLTLNEGEYHNSYVCSPYGFFIGCGKHKLHNMTNPLIRNSFLTLIAGTGTFLKKARFNRVITVNNWLLSINLYPHLTPSHLESIKNLLEKKYPHHAILFQSINDFQRPDFTLTMAKQGFDLILSRRIFLYDPKDPKVLKTRAYKSDLKLLRESGYELITNQDIQLHDLPRIVQLYHSLYVDKHSPYNPQLNEQFFKHALEQNVFHFVALKRYGKIDAFAGYYEYGGWMTNPIVGFDTKMASQLDLYRQITMALCQESLRKGLIFNMSSGAATFKQQRGAKEVLNYMAIYTKHLPWSRRLPWKLLGRFMNGLGLSFMRSYQI